MPVPVFVRLPAPLIVPAKVVLVLAEPTVSVPELTTLPPLEPPPDRAPIVRFWPPRSSVAPAVLASTIAVLVPVVARL